jgi:hypothetical protein
MVQGRRAGLQNTKGGHRGHLYWYPPRAPVAARSNEIDKKCPFTGQISIRGRILSGIVVSAKMHRTIIIR